MTGSVHEGGCQCGAVRYRTTAAPMRAMACHCTACKLRTGAPYGIGVYFDDNDVEFNDGERGTFEFHSDTSNRWIRNEFCKRCGTAVSWTLEMRPGKILALLEKADLLRRPDRLEAFVQACEADWRGREGLSERPYPQAERLRAALDAALAVKAESLDIAGLAGEAIGMKLRAARIEAIKKLCT